MKLIVASVVLSLLPSSSEAFVSPQRHVAATTPSPGVRIHRVAGRRTVLGESEGPPGYPNVINYPDPGWGISKPAPKQSLVDVGMAWSAKAWILNVIEFVHWFSFPIGFALFWKLFTNADALGKAVNPSAPTLGIFFLMLAHLSQVYGGGISGNLMHQYEGWQVSVFRSPLTRYTDPATGITEQEPQYNDAWLRAVAYQMLFSFQTLGVLFTAIGVYGIQSNKFMQLLTAVSGFVICLAPQLPHCTTVFPNLMKKVGCSRFWTWLTKDRPVFPLSIWLFLVFLVNSFVATAAYIQMFGKIDWTGNPLLGMLPPAVSAVIPFFLVAFGGIFEGLVAETTFNQWHHFLAFVGLDTGLFLHIPYYMKLIA